MTDPRWGQASAWQKLRAAQVARAKQATVALVPGRLPRNDFARRFWSRRTWSEYAAVPAVSQVVLALVREDAPFDSLAAFSTIAADEARHAQLSRGLADAMGGYDDEPPEGSGYAPRSLAEPSNVPVLVWAIANGCFSETVSLALIRARHRATPKGPAKAVLEETLKDEAVHVAVGWQLAEGLVRRAPQAVRKDLFAYGQQLGEMLRRTFGTAGLPRAARKRERALRDRTHAKGLGSIGADEEDAVVEASLAAVFERLEALGVRAPRAPGSPRRRA